MFVDYISLPATKNNVFGRWESTRGIFSQLGVRLVRKKPTRAEILLSPTTKEISISGGNLEKKRFLVSPEGRKYSTGNEK